MGPPSDNPDQPDSPATLSSKFLRKANFRPNSLSNNPTEKLSGDPNLTIGGIKGALESPAAQVDFPKSPSFPDTTISSTSISSDAPLSSEKRILATDVDTSGASASLSVVEPIPLPLDRPDDVAPTPADGNIAAASPSAESDIASSSASSPRAPLPEAVPDMIEPLRTASVSSFPLSPEELDDAKNLVLDLLGWGVAPEYLVESGVSAHAIFRIFTDLNLRLPANLVVSEDTKAVAYSWGPKPPELADLEHGSRNV